MKKICIPIVFLLSFVNSYAAVRNVPSVYATIQSALNACVTGDTVMVQAGMYLENITWPNTANINLVSAGDSSNTTISGNNSGRVLNFTSAIVDTNTVIRGFKITNGFVTGSAANGGGVYMNASSPRFDAVSITGNHILAANWGYGAGVYCNNSSAVFNNSTIWANQTDTASWGYGGGVYMSNGGNPIFRNVKIDGNYVNSDSWNYGTGVYCSGSNPTFLNVSVSANTTGKDASWYYGTGMFFEESIATLTNVLVASNKMATGGNWYFGAGICVRNSSTSNHLTMMNVTITDNRKTDGTTINGSGLFVDVGDTVIITNAILWNTNTGAEINNTGFLTIGYSDVRGGYAGTGNILTNPAFVSTTNFHLSTSSPCLGTGTLVGAPAFDLDNNPRPFPVATNPDMGCYESSSPVALNSIVEANFSLYNYPNPFSKTTTIVFSGARTAAAKYSLAVFDAAGRMVSHIKNISAATFTFSRQGLQNGIYFYRLHDGEKTIGIGKMVVD